MSRSGEKKTGARFWGIHFVFPAQAGLSQARPWPPGGTHFFDSAAGWPGHARWPAPLLGQNTYFPLVFQGFLHFLTPWEFNF